MKYGFAIIYLLFCITAQAQLVFSDNKVVGVVSDVNGAVVSTFRPDNVQGNPYFGEEWSKGTVYFAKGKRADSLLLQFDLTVNKIYFKREGVVQLFLNEVEAFNFYNAGDGIPANILFRCGYPANGNYNSSHFYEVLVDGSLIQLLKYRSTKITEAYVYNAPSIRSYKTSTELYVYNTSTKEIQKIKPDKKTIKKTLPAFADKINTLCQQNSWVLKTEAELTQLIQVLNNQ